MLPANHRIVHLDLISRPVPSLWTIFQIGKLVVAGADTEWMIFTCFAFSVDASSILEIVFFEGALKYQIFNEVFVYDFCLYGAHSGTEQCFLIWYCYGTSYQYGKNVSSFQNKTNRKPNSGRNLK